jgi:HEPN domain-containing protein
VRLFDQEEYARWWDQARHTLNSARRDALLRLLESFSQMGIAVPEAIWEAARELDPHYIPARYPDAFPTGSPFQFYSRKRAEGALEAAQQVLDWVEREVQGVA